MLTMEKGEKWNKLAMLSEKDLFPTGQKMRVSFPFELETSSKKHFVALGEFYSMSQCGTNLPRKIVLASNRKCEKYWKFKHVSVYCDSPFELLKKDRVGPRPTQRDLSNGTKIQGF